jgi:hypothetical protein
MKSKFLNSDDQQSTNFNQTNKHPPPQTKEHKKKNKIYMHILLEIHD